MCVNNKNQQKAVTLKNSIKHINLFHIQVKKKDTEQKETVFGKEKKNDYRHL